MRRRSNLIAIGSQSPIGIAALDGPFWCAACARLHSLVVWRRRAV